MSAVGDVLVVLDAGLAAELAPPVVDGVLHLGGRPVADLLVQGRAGRPDHQEAVHEGIVDRPLQAVPLAKRAVVVGCDRLAHLPSTLRKWAIHERSESGSGASTSSPSIIDDAALGDVERDRAVAGGDRQRQGRDILGRDLGASVAVTAEQIGVDAGLLPVLLQAVDLDPGRPVVTQRPGGEVDLDGHRIAADARRSDRSAD